VPRACELDITVGLLPRGPTGSILDVPGVGVGHHTVWRDEPTPPAGRGVARTGVTVIDPGGSLFHRPVPAGGAVLNGAGECTGFLALGEWGLLETPVFLTSTMQVGRVYDAACRLLMEEEPAIGVQDVIIPVVAECDDSFLNEARAMQVTLDDVRDALRAARESVGGPAPEEGAVGSGTGMVCLGYKGGIGTASRRTPTGHTVGVLLMSNFGERERLTIDGVPVGRLLHASSWWRQTLRWIRRPAGGSRVGRGWDSGGRVPPPRMAAARSSSPSPRGCAAPGRPERHPPEPSRAPCHSPDLHWTRSSPPRSRRPRRRFSTVC
jgi:D-aminopeptidase